MQTAKDGATPAKMDGGGVRGPLKNFRAGSSSAGGGRRGKRSGRVGGIREKRGRGENSDSYYSGEGSSGNEYSDGGSQVSTVQNRMTHPELVSNGINHCV